MSILDWSKCPAVESVPDRRSGEWVLRNTRMPVKTVFENLEDMSGEEVAEIYGCRREQIATVLDFVVQSLAQPEIDARLTASHAHSV
jgi:uncharacterized protein (DUF433 family)